VSRKLIISSRNEGKIREVRRNLEGLGIEWVTWKELADWPPLVEDGSSYYENALKKAESLSRFAGWSALADDSGLEVEALGGAPGVLSARYAGPEGDDQMNIRRLLSEMQGLPEEERSARFVCVLVLYFPGGEHLSVEGECEGTIVREPRGEGGFGYDPVFQPRGYQLTFAQLAPEEKDALSHRGRALRKLKKMLLENPGLLRKMEV